MKRALFPLLILAGLTIAACGGSGGGSGNFVAQPTATPPSGGTFTISPLAYTGPITFYGSGYLLTFNVPPTVTGTTATATGGLSGTLPQGVPAPSLAKRKTSLLPGSKIPNTVGVPLTPLVYFTISTTAQVGFADAPTFQFIDPVATTVPNGSQAYLLFYDPTQSANGWVPLLGPATLAAYGSGGQSMTFPAVQTGVNFYPNQQYIFALVAIAQSVPTATPAPTPTVGPSTAPGGAPAYCRTFQSYTAPPNGSAPVPLNLTDDSGLNGTLVVYVENAQTSPVTYLAPNATWTAQPVALPAVCFSNTTPSVVSGKPLVIPNPGNGRILIAYAPGTPNPAASTAPNPLPSGVGTNPDYNSAMLPWDVAEYTIPGGVIDTSQVGFMGLPMELSLVSSLPHQSPVASCPAPPPAPGPQAQPTTVGFSSCAFLDAFNDVWNNPSYRSLVIAEPFPNSGSPTYALRLLAPQQAGFTQFDWYDLFSSPADAPLTGPCNAGNTGTGGYLQCVLTFYKNNPQVFSSSRVGVGASGDYYCASANSALTAFTFTDVGSTQPSSCNPMPPANPNAPSTANPFSLPISTFIAGQAPTQDDAGCSTNNLFSIPFGTFYVNGQSLPSPYQPTGNLFQNLDTFAMWKALGIDLNYGTAMVSGLHPGGLSALPAYPTNADFWQDPAFNYYGQVLHHYADGGYTYAVAYDDFYGWSTSLTIASGQSINIRVNQVPQFGHVQALPTAAPFSGSCPVMQAPIGSY
jgi:hypothetical protein